MKHRNNGGFSLVEMLVAIVILGLITVPMLSGMVVAMKTIARSEDMMKAQLAVSSAVETLMSKGIDPSLFNNEETKKIVDETSFPGLTVTVESVDGQAYYKVTVTYYEDDDALVTVDTFIRQGGSE